MCIFLQTSSSISSNKNVILYKIKSVYVYVQCAVHVYNIVFFRAVSKDVIIQPGYKEPKDKDKLSIQES